MAHRMIDEEGLRTSRSGVPRVEFQTVEDGSPTVRVTFTSSRLDNGIPGHHAVVTFSEVLDFRWTDFDLGILPGNQHDAEFGLQEIEESELVRPMMDRDRNLHPPEKVGGGVDWDSVHHYRIVFDDHGAYDVVCFEMQVEFVPT